MVIIIIIIIVITDNKIITETIFTDKSKNENNNKYAVNAGRGVERVNIQIHS